MRIKMNEVFSSITIIILIVAFILWVMVIKRMAHEIYELKVKLEQHRIRFNYLEFDYSSISDLEERIDKLEEVLELKEYFDEEPLSK